MVFVQTVKTPIFLFTLLSLLPWFSALGAGPNETLPPEADKYLKKLPNGKLNAEYVVLRGIQSADAFRLLGVQWKAAQLEEDMQLVPFDWNLRGSYNLLDNRFQVLNPFAPTRTQGWDWNLGLEKTFDTGTNVDVSWNHSRRDLEFDAIPASFRNPAGGSGGTGAFLNDFHQTVAQIKVSQDLLKNFFGRASRQGLKAARLRVQSTREQIKNQFSTQAVQLAGAFYSAWSLQEQVRSRAAFVKRTKKLLRVVTKKHRNGAVELPEKLQMEALLSIAEGEKQEIQNQLVQVWQNLVISLKLPPSFLDVDPILVPTELDNPVPEAIHLCENQKTLEETLETQSLRLALKSLESQLRSVKSMGLPELKLTGQYSGNGVDGQGGVASEEIFQGLGPAWQVGLMLNVPLGFRDTRVQRTRLAIEKIKLESQLKVAEQQSQSQWLARCQRLKLDRSNESRFASILDNQRRRMKSEEKRFAYGRVTVNDLVTAENDLGDWELRVAQQKAKTRLAAWEILQIHGSLYKKFEPILQKALQ